jgi:hypothetical protein
MGNVIILAALAIFALGCELWLRRMGSQRTPRRFARR